MSALFLLFSQVPSVALAETTETKLTLLGGLSLQSTKRVEYGSFLENQEVEEIRNTEPLSLVIDDHRAQKEHGFTILVNIELTNNLNQEDMKIESSGTDFILDPEEAKFSADGKQLPESCIHKCKPLHLLRDKDEAVEADFQPLIQINKSNASRYLLTWGVGTIGIKMEEGLPVGDYSIVTNWQITDAYNGEID
ncbi:MAG: hypothetical protein LBD38_00675 [Streptococcaceae bacterium]|jgi:hypothetical protein|nr:hypothetical protein [Streptococcaceae bacterium]